MLLQSVLFIILNFQLKIDYLMEIVASVYHLHLLEQLFFL